MKEKDRIKSNWIVTGLWRHCNHWLSGLRHTTSSCVRVRMATALYTIQMCTVHRVHVTGTATSVSRLLTGVVPVHYRRVGLLSTVTRCTDQKRQFAAIDARKLIESERRKLYILRWFNNERCPHDCWCRLVLLANAAARIRHMIGASLNSHNDVAVESCSIRHLTVRLCLCSVWDARTARDSHQQVGSVFGQFCTFYRNYQLFFSVSCWNT